MEVILLTPMLMLSISLSLYILRAIVHPRVLTFRNPRKALEELLSYSEYAQPWRLYQTPGLLATVLAHITWIGMLTRIVRHLTVPALGGLPPSTPADRNDDNYTGHANGSMEVTTLGLAVFLTWCVLSVIVLSPLECVTVRLSVQRPERQQPLHLAYARATARGTAAAAGPAPYNNQAQVLSNSNPGAQESAYQDAVPAKEANNQPSEAAARPSFAITDDDDDDLDVDGRTKQADQQKESLLGGVKGGDDETDSAAAPKTTATPAPAPATAASGPPPRVLGGGPPPSHMAPPPANFPYSADTNQPSEPVIALRPCDEPQSAEEAARAEEQGFGAPTVERYTGMIDCLNKLVDEEGIEALYRGSWVTLLGVLVGNFS